MFSFLYSACSMITRQGNIKARKVANNNVINNMLYLDDKDDVKLPLLQQQQQITSTEKGRGGATEVKILMTKEEAARLLSKFKDGGVIKFKDVAHELVQIPVDRVTVASSSTSTITDRLAKELELEKRSRPCITN